MALDRIVVPLDGSATAEAVLPDVLRLLEPAGPELVLVHVAPALDPQGYSPEAQKAKAYLRSVQARLSAGGVTARAVLMAGAPAAAILRRAEKDEADLIGLTAPAGGDLGGVAGQLLRRSRVPLLVRRSPRQPADDAPPPERAIRSLLLPLDGSDRALLALPTAVALCRRHAARLFLLQVRDPVLAADDAEADAYLRDIEIQAQDQGVAVTTTLLSEGDAAGEILDVVRFHHVDLIVLASHGKRGKKERPFVGRVAEALLRRAPVPLVLVPAADGEVDPPAPARPAAQADAPSSPGVPKAPAASC